MKDQTLKLSPVAVMLKDGPEVPSIIQLLPFGDLDLPQGRFHVTKESIRSILQQFKAKATDIVIDYEHQTEMGVEAPAAGWIQDLIDRGEEGLWATVQWTKRAIEYLMNREYRYVSPSVFYTRETREIRTLVAAALTNRPAIDGMKPVVAKGGLSPQDREEIAMLKKLLAKLGMSDGTPEEKAIEEVGALVALKAKVAEVLGMKPEDLKPDAIGTELLTMKNRLASTEVLQVLELKDDATLKDVQAKVVALKNPGSYVGREEFEALQLKLKKRDADDLVGQAMSQGKIAPAQEEWAREYALKDPTGFAAFTEKAAPVVPVNKRIGIPPEDPGAHNLNDDTLLVAKQFGLTKDDLVKFGGINADDEN